MIASPSPQADSLIGWRGSNSLFKTYTSEFSITVETNSLGFRDSREFNVAADSQRIVFIGDSFTFGSGVEYGETFSARLEQNLRRVRSYNFGMSGFGLDQMWMTLKHMGLQVRPNLVIVSFVDDDLRRSLSAYRWQWGLWWEKPTFRLVDDTLARMTAADRRSGPIRFIERHSRLLQAWRQLDWRHSLKDARGKGWRLNEAIFRSISRDCISAQASLVVIRIPQLGHWGPAPARNRAITGLGIEFLDLATFLPPNPDTLYFPINRHLTPSGHRWVAATLETFLIDRGLARSKQDSQAPPL